jgi:hypothetical protein
VINESLCHGIRGEDLVSRLEGWQAPHNVVETAREWIREFSRVSLSAETILISADEKVTRQLTALPALQQNLEPVKAHQVFRVPPQARRQVEEILFGLGFDPRTPRLTSCEPPDAGASRETIAPHPVPVFHFRQEPREAAAHPMSGKYSSEMKALDVNEMLHVLDYAILMGCCVRIRYGGSKGIKAGAYRVRPVSCERGPLPTVTGETPDGRSRRRFLVKEIAKLGVEES